MINVYTDGACKGNPGVGGWGVFITACSFERCLWGGEANTTNNRMELTAAIEGLNALTSPTMVQLTTDSVYVKNGITQWIAKWRTNRWLTSARKPVANQDLWQALDNAVARHQEVTWHWVKGHSGHLGNERADELANQGVEAVHSQSHMLCFDSGRYPTP